MTSQQLECGGETKEIASRRTDGVAGKEAGEIENVEAVVEIFCVGLQMDGAAFFLVKFGTRRQVKRERRLDASVGEIKPVDHPLAIFSQSLSVRSSEIEG